MQYIIIIVVIISFRSILQRPINKTKRRYIWYWRIRILFENFRFSVKDQRCKIIHANEKYSNSAVVNDGCFNLLHIDTALNSSEFEVDLASLAVLLVMLCSVYQNRSSEKYFNPFIYLFIFADNKL